MNVEMLRAREKYGEKAVGYVQLKREGKCIVKAEIASEHRMPQKPYNVMVINEKEESIQQCICMDSTALTGGCKHAAAFLFWLHGCSEDPSVTDIVLLEKHTLDKSRENYYILYSEERDLRKIDFMTD